MSRASLICGVALLGAILFAWATGPMDQKGGTGMFGLFGSKKSAQHGSVVAPELGSMLQPQAALPEKIDAPVASSYPECELLTLDGYAPSGKWVTGPDSGEEPQPVFFIPGASGEPALAILSGVDGNMQVWELSAEQPFRFVKQRTISMDSDQASWIQYSAYAVSCLPGQQAVFAVGYAARHVKEGLYVYARAANQYRLIEEIESDMNGPPPYSSFETLIAAADAKLVRYRTGVIRVRAHLFAYQHEHILLFSKRFPQGLEILKLGIDDGNVRRWIVLGNQLWLETIDRRKRAQSFTWSLNLEKVL